MFHALWNKTRKWKSDENLEKVWYWTRALQRVVFKKKPFGRGGGERNLKSRHSSVFVVCLISNIQSTSWLVHSFKETPAQYKLLSEITRLVKRQYPNTQTDVLRSLVVRFNYSGCITCSRGVGRGEGVVALPYNSNGPTMNPGVRFNQSIIYLIPATYWDRDMQCNPLSVGCSVNRAGQISKPLPFPPPITTPGQGWQGGSDEEGFEGKLHVYVRKGLDFRLKLLLDLKKFIVGCVNECGTTWWIIRSQKSMALDSRVWRAAGSIPDLDDIFLSM